MKSIAYEVFLTFHLLEHLMVLIIRIISMFSQYSLFVNTSFYLNLASWKKCTTNFTEICPSNSNLVMLTFLIIDFLSFNFLIYIQAILLTQFNSNYFSISIKLLNFLPFCLNTVCGGLILFDWIYEGSIFSFHLIRLDSLWLLIVCSLAFVNMSPVHFLSKNLL